MYNRRGAGKAGAKLQKIYKKRDAMNEEWYMNTKNDIHMWRWCPVAEWRTRCSRTTINGSPQVGGQNAEFVRGEDSLQKTLCDQIAAAIPMGMRVGCCVYLALWHADGARALQIFAFESLKPPKQMPAEPAFVD